MLVFKVQESLKPSAVTPTVITADGERHIGHTAWRRAPGGLTVSAGADVCPSEALCLPLEVSVYLDGEATEGGEVSVCLVSPIGEQCETRPIGGQDDAELPSE